MGTLKRQSNGPLYSNTVIGTLAVDGWATARSGQFAEWRHSQSYTTRCFITAYKLTHLYAVTGNLIRNAVNIMKI